jgi:hypothetical protein
MSAIARRAASDAGVEPEDLQGLQGVHRRRPGLPRFAAGIRRREQGAAIPQPVGTLKRQETGAPALALHARSLGGVGVEQQSITLTAAA